MNPAGHDHRGLELAVVLLLTQEITDVGTEPGIFGSTAPALVHRDVGKSEAGAGTHRFGDQPRRGRILFFVRISRRHARGNAVGGEDQRGAVAQGGGQRRQRALRLLRRRLDVTGAGVPVADVDDLDVRQSLLAERRPRVAHVLAILKATRITAVGGGDEPDRPANAGPRHRGERVGQEWMPVPHTDEHRQVEAGGLKPLAEPGRLRTRQLGERRDAAEMLIVMRHLFDTFGRNPSSTQHICEEGPDVIGTVRAAKGDEQHGVERV